MTKHPLGLPEGSVRSLIVLLLVITVCAMSALGRVITDPLKEGFFMALGMYGLFRVQQAAQGTVTVPDEPPDPPKP